MKNNVAIMFGGCSSEYSISLVSATSVIKNINKKKYNILMIGISKEGDFYLYNGDVDKIEKDEWLNSTDTEKITISSNRSDGGIILLDENKLIKVDIAFPVMHGRNGEDGRLQGLLELAGIKYVGCDMTSSAICMDKYLSHELVSSSGILAPISYLFDKNISYNEIYNKVSNLKFPIFVKPLKAGSSLGITKVSDINNLKLAIVEAFKYDNKIIIEENIEGFEVGCSIMGDNSLIIGEVDEIELGVDFFDYHEKYNQNNSVIHLPARVTDEEKEKIKNTALSIYKILGCTGFARVDMFYTKDKKIVFNEVNTIPGFTAHSRFPRMLKQIGLSFEEVIDNLIEMRINGD